VPGRPNGVCFDYGRTLVDFARPEAAIAAVGVSLAKDLALAGSSWPGTPAGFALALDQLVDELIRARQSADPWREVDFDLLHREAMRQLLGAWPSEELSLRVGETLQRSWVAGVAPIEPAVKVLIQLKERGMRLGLCSNAPFPPHLMYEQLERLELRQYFDAVIFSSEIGWRKPDPRIFSELLQRLGLAARAVWFLGDEWEADVEGATAAGMRAILAPGANAPSEGGERLDCWEDLLTLVG